MARLDLTGKMKALTALLCLSVLVVWVLFLVHSTRNIRLASEENIQQVSGQILERLELELLGLETLSFTLSRHEAVLDYAAEIDPLTAHTRTARVDALMDTLLGPADFAQNLIIYNQQGIPANFLGMLGSTATEQLITALPAQEQPRYTAITLEGVRYIAHGQSLYQGEQALGTLVLLAEEEKLLGLFGEYTTEDLQVSLAEDGILVTSSEEMLAGLPVAAVEAGDGLFLRRAIGFTPFEIVVTVDDSYFTRIYADYLAGAILSTLLFMLLLVFFLNFSNRHFFRPMVEVIRQVEELGVAEDKQSIQKTGEAPFDNLVEQVNRMLERLDAKNRALLEATTELRDVEIERQRSLITSLKKQIDAHFTVNVLGNIRALATQGEGEKAAEMTDGLSRLLRYANEEDPFISGIDEILMLQQYVTIMQIRHGERFEVDFDWDDRLSDIRIPRMLLQPLVENAFRHGLLPVPGPGLLRVRGTLEGERAVFQVEDNGRGFTSAALNALRGQLDEAGRPLWEVFGIERVSLVNIQRRVWLYYGEGWGLDIQNEKGEGTVVTLTLPTASPNHLPKE